MENQQPEALRLADKYEIEGFLQDHRFAKDHWCRQAAAELRRLHARNQELEASLQKLQSDYEAVGAGGVSAQRVTQGKDHIAQPIQRATTTVVLPEPIGTVGAAPGTSSFTLTVFEAARVPVGTNIYTEQQVRELLDKAACTKSQTQEPFDYFKAEPFGWRDCAETDEGAIALYEAPQPQADARDAELVAAVVYASTEAMNSSMESPSFDGTIILESHPAASLILALDELEQHRAAIAAAKGKSK
jgi:prefoldin subunit 5